MGLWLSGCALFTPPEKNKHLDRERDEMFLINEEIRAQRDEISRLKRTIAQMEKRFSETVFQKPKTGPSSPILAEKLEGSDKDEKTGFESATLIGKKDFPTEREGKDANEGITIVDSSQEVLHEYFVGLEFYRSKKWDKASDSFRKFIIANPEHVYSDRAQYLIADTHFQNRDFGLVIVATNLLEARYPYSMKLPDALLKRAFAFSELKQKEQALVTLQNLVKRYPADPVAHIASQKIIELKTVAN